ncbi:MAG: Protoporphyrinogen oxidase [Promethearchaeota archaeon CR_4]|nr:MAG: Protoporphyrinogen oxidase [Candidatus Lokiarchaeota archaeon CR_4]
MKVLIAYGTRYGSTEEIAARIGQILHDAGLTTDVVNLKTTKMKPDVAAYDGWIVGSGIQMGHWTKVAKSFLSKNKWKFTDSTKLAIFLSCGTAKTPEGRDKAKKDYILPLLTSFGLQNARYDAFGGFYDFTDSSRVGSFFKKIMKKALEEDGVDVSAGKIDQRDWGQIESFAKDYGNFLKELQK